MLPLKKQKAALITRTAFYQVKLKEYLKAVINFICMKQGVPVKSLQFLFFYRFLQEYICFRKAFSILFNLNN